MSASKTPAKVAKTGPAKRTARKTAKGEKPKQS
jgi:hypothetical protein